VLDAAQLAAVLLSLDLATLLPDWAAAGLSAVLMTQATTWQWVPFECLVPGSSAASGAVLQAILVMLLPGEHLMNLLHNEKILQHFFSILGGGWAVSSAHDSGHHVAVGAF
jgi:hypothetical protein